MSNTRKRILVVVTSHAKLGDSGKPTGFWLEELAVPYRVFADAGCDIDIASPLGGAPPADPASHKEGGDVVKAFLADATASAKLANTTALEKVSGTYDTVFVAGGHGNPASTRAARRSRERRSEHAKRAQRRAGPCGTCRTTPRSRA